MAIFDSYFASKSNLAGGGPPERVVCARITAGLFPLLGVAPRLGRSFTLEEETPGRDGVVILSHDLWRRRFAADRGVLGRTLTINGKSCEVVGVMPAGFEFPGGLGTVMDAFINPLADRWPPLALDAQSWQARGLHYLQAIARVKPGISPDQAERQ
jgi:putative ABC transport system permease protein